MSTVDPNPAVAAAVARLAGQLDEITRVVRFEPALLDLSVVRVSRWSVGQQVDHILKVLEVGQRFFEGPRDPLPRGINLPGRIALALRWFPRGVARSPKAVLPGEISPADLAGRASRLRKFYCDTRLPEGVLADTRPIFPHPFFGGLDGAQSLRFLEVHTHHHMSIVADIRRAAPDRSAP